MRASWAAEATLDADDALVWSVLVDFEAYPSWNPFTREVRTQGVIGEPVVMSVDMGALGMVQQSETLRVWEPRRTLVWALDTWPSALLWARRTQTLTPLADGRTHYRTVDEIGGLLLPIVRWRYGDALTVGFTNMANALRDEVARRAAR